MRNARVVRYGPRTLTIQVYHQFSGSLSVMEQGGSITPALLTRISTLPNFFPTSAAASSTLFWLATSRVIGRTSGSFLPAEAAASLMACTRGSSLERAPTAMKDAPAFAKDIEMALPMPLDAPEMKTLLPARFAFWGSIAG